MTTVESLPELRHGELAAGPSRIAVFKRTYDATIDDVWDACTDPARLARWYTPVTGDLRLGGAFHQVNMGSGEIAVCQPPSQLTLTFGGVDQIDLRLTAVADGTELELQHATTLDQHHIGGQLYDAIFCMGGGYYPRLEALGLHLDGTLPADYDSAEFYLRPDMRPTIARGSAAMSALLESDGARTVKP